MMGLIFDGKSGRLHQVLPSARQVLFRSINLGVVFAFIYILIISKIWISITVVLSGSMEPGFKRGDALILSMSKDPIRAGDIVVFNLEGKPIPIVHRVVEVHERRDTGEINVLTKGDHNLLDDRRGDIFVPGQIWLHRDQIIARVVGFLPYVGWPTIIMTEHYIIKYVLLAALGSIAIISKD